MNPRLRLGALAACAGVALYALLARGARFEAIGAMLPDHLLEQGAEVLQGSAAAILENVARAGARETAGFKGAWIETDEGFRLERPPIRMENIGPVGKKRSKAQGPYYAMGYQYDSRIFERPADKPRMRGTVRRGTQLIATERVRGPGCSGMWYRLALGGYVCTKEGFSVTRTPQTFWIRQPKVDVDQPVFYRYARVVTQGAPRFHRIPTKAEEALFEQKRAPDSDPKLRMPDVVQGELIGDYFVALDRVEEVEGRSFYRTMRGRYLRERDVLEREPPAMNGEMLSDALSLPLAFVYGDDDAPLLRNRGGRFERVGSASVHARFPLVGLASDKEDEYAMGPDGFAVPTSRLRLALRIDRPEEISASQKWIHVDLTEQTLVAYEGDEPVFATLISSGKEEHGHATPTGLFRVREKHVSVTMSGEDPRDGMYEVAAVPWTQFYHESYALHGAYWHDTFGMTRSHGCTNVSPPDARFLFYWTSPEVQTELHSVRVGEGTAIYLTRDHEVAAVDDEQES